MSDNDKLEHRRRLFDRAFFWLVFWTALIDASAAWGIVVDHIAQQGLNPSNVIASIATLGAIAHLRHSIH